MEVSLRTKIIVGFFWGLGILLLCFGAGGEVLIFFVIGFICLKVGQKFYKEDETPKESTPKQLIPKQIEMKERQEKIRLNHKKIHFIIRRFKQKSPY